MASDTPARPGYGYERIPLLGGEADGGAYRIFDPADNRIATSYLEENARTIVAALNGEIGPPVQFRREHALEVDPYRFVGYGFADCVDEETDKVHFQDVAGNTAPRIVRRRILDDVEAAHRMLDNIGVEAGPLTARIGLAVTRAVREPAPTFVTGPARLGVTVPDRVRRSHGSGEPLADATDVTVPSVDALLPKLLELSGEDAFRIFDKLGLCENIDRHTIQGWNFTAADSVRGMVRLCVGIALDTGKMSELAKAVDDHTARAGR